MRGDDNKRKAREDMWVYNTSALLGIASTLD
jgi:hypothetical protein